MKSYTDLEQSKKLAEILPIESADMCFNDNEPCWSLAALLEIMPKQLGRYTLTLYWCDNSWYYDSWCCSYIDDGSEIKEISSANNPVDAIVKMIVKLKEKDLL